MKKKLFLVPWGGIGIGALIGRVRMSDSPGNSRHSAFDIRHVSDVFGTFFFSKRVEIPCCTLSVYISFCSALHAITSMFCVVVFFWRGKLQAAISTPHPSLTPPFYSKEGEGEEEGEGGK